MQKNDKKLFLLFAASNALPSKALKSPGFAWRFESNVGSSQNRRFCGVRQKENALPGHGAGADGGISGGSQAG